MEAGLLEGVIALTKQELRDSIKAISSVGGADRPMSHGLAEADVFALVANGGRAMIAQITIHTRPSAPVVALMSAEVDTRKRVCDMDAGFMLHAPDFAPAALERRLITREPLVVALPLVRLPCNAPSGPGAMMGWGAMSAEAVGRAGVRAGVGAARASRAGNSSMDMGYWPVSQIAERSIAPFRA